MVSCWLETQFVVCTCFEIPPLLQSIGSLEQVFLKYLYRERKINLEDLKKPFFCHKDTLKRQDKLNFDIEVQKCSPKSPNLYFGFFNLLRT